MKTKTIFFIIACMLLSVSPAFTSDNGFCECSHRNDFEREFEISNSVFTGKVIDIDQTSAPDVLTTIEIKKTWKGDITEKVVIHSRKGKSCGYMFSRGEEYLVYAYEEAGDLQASTCSRTSEIKAAADDLKKLDGKIALHNAPE